MAFRMHRSGIKVVRATFLREGFRETSKDFWNVMWSSAHLKSFEFQGLHRHQRVNQFPRSMEITRKDALCRNISRMQVLHGYAHFGFIPRSFILPADHSQLVAAADKTPAALWIVKPASSAQGKGIYVTDDVASVQVNTREDNAMVTEYVANPLLVDGIKFDLRIYVAVTSFNPLRAYVYEEGLARFATTKYSTDAAALHDRFMHLTNYSVNKHSDTFVDADDDGSGSKWTLGALWARLSADGVDVDTLLARIDDIVVKTLISIEAQVNAATDMFVAHHSNCFELFGFDILIDDALRPWLLEVNFAPSLNVDAPLDHRVKAPLVADLFTLAGIPHFDARRIRPKGLNRGRNPSSRLHKAATSATPLAARPSSDGGGGTVGRGRAGRTAGLLGVRSLSPASRREVLRAVEERARAPRFRPVFPVAHSHMYARFFERELPTNTLLANYFFQLSNAGPAADGGSERGPPRRWGAEQDRRGARPPAPHRGGGDSAGTADLRSPPTSPLRTRPGAAGGGISAARRLGREKSRAQPTGDQLLVLQRRHARSASQQLPTFT